MIKLTTPNQVALLCAACIGIISFGIVLLVDQIAGSELAWLSYLIVPVGVFLLAYLVLFIAIERFIFGKIKIIYKNIHRLKLRPDNKPVVDMRSDMLGKVTEEVVDWASANEDELKKLRDQEEFRRTFIGNLAHELKTPIFSIQGHILTLLEGGLEDEAVNRKFLERAAKGVDRMTHIIEDLDTITRMESDAMKLEMTRFDVTQLIKETIDSLEMKAAEKSVSITLVGGDRPMSVLADRSKIGQVLANLLVNSINYGREDGKTKIRIQDMHDHYLFEVADDGPGISAEHLPRLFERFYRVDKSRSRNQGGTGLGLAIVKHIIESHQQTINVRSTPGVGSTFSFTLRKVG